MNRCLLFVAVLGLALLTWPAQARSRKLELDAKATQGDPGSNRAAQAPVRVWSDEHGLHVRWLPQKSPTLFAGRLDLDHDATGIVRVRPSAGGWVTTDDPRRVLFSATVKTEPDGFDLRVPAGTRATIDVVIDGVAATPEKLAFGARATRPPVLPTRFKIP